MARARSKKVDSITPAYYPCESSCGRTARPQEVDDYEKYAELFEGNFEGRLGETIDVTSFVKEIAC